MAKSNRASSAEVAAPTWIADRYQVECTLGRGGMAEVYRVRDTTGDRTVALKLLRVAPDARGGDRVAMLFEREFHTLAQLEHPRVVQALDYGVDALGTYYTMELLDGGDLATLAPLSPLQACTVLYDVCSALCLLHSRRLIHRDLTPRNLRCTADGKAKIIDFGLLSPMGPSELVAGTAPYVAPELVHQIELDGRSDLFSLGATIYYALTGEVPYLARNFRELTDAWRTRPDPPSKLVEGIPPELDHLVLAMIRVDRGSRPKSAAEVMELVLPLLGSPPDEQLNLRRAYLSTPALVGRGQNVAQVRRMLVRAVRSRGGTVVFRGEPGLGGSRMLDAFALEAKLIGATALRANAANAEARFSVAATLIRQALASAPEAAAGAMRTAKLASDLFSSQGGASTEAPTLVDLQDPTLKRGDVLGGLLQWFQAFSASQPLAIAVDDVCEIDEPSVALLASLAASAPTHRIACAVCFGAPPTACVSSTVATLLDYGVQVELAPLNKEHMGALLRSVFGETPNLQLLCEWVQQLSHGHPREAMALAHHLVEQGALSYRRGSWVLPDEAGLLQLPGSLESALSMRVQVWAPPVRRIAQLLCLCLLGRLSRAQLLRLHDAQPEIIDRAIDALVSAHALTGGVDGYGLAHEGWIAAVKGTVIPEDAERMHSELADLYKGCDAHPIVAAYHLFHAGRLQGGLACLMTVVDDSDAAPEMLAEALEELGGDHVVATVDLALRQVEQGAPGVSQTQLQLLRASLGFLSALGQDVGYYYRSAPAWLEQLKRDSGFDDWVRLDPASDPGARTMQALQIAFERYGQSSEADRGLPPDQAIKALVRYAVISIAVGGRTHDTELMRSLPDLLVPFASLNPLVDAVMRNTIAARLSICECRPEQAREEWLAVHRDLQGMVGEDPAVVTRMRDAIAYGLGVMESWLGLPSATVWADQLEQNKSQAVNAQYIRKIAAMLRGDWEAAERHRSEAELIKLRDNTPQMFANAGIELQAHAMARDLTGLKHVMARMGALAAAAPNWLPYKHLAEGHHHRLCGAHGEALVAVQASLETTGYDDEASEQRPPPAAWAAAIAAYVDTLVDVGRVDDAVAAGRAAEALCRRWELRSAGHRLVRALALAEASAGQCDRAAERLRTVIAEQQALGVRALPLGASYEAVARIAILAGDKAAFQEAAAHTAEEYRVHDGSVLGALYERLMEEARGAGLVAGEAGTGSLAAKERSAIVTAARVATAMRGCAAPADRAQRVLGLLCDGVEPRRGYLFLLTADGLKLAARNTVETDLRDLESVVSEYLARELGEVDDETSVGDVSTATVEAETGLGVWTSPAGIRYRPVLLGARVDRHSCCAGVAMLTIGGDYGQQVEAYELAGELATRLVEAGDAQWVRHS